MSQLKIFVSSTCYDLAQIRADLFDFISNLGYQPVLSEYSSFPIDPDNDTLDNCIQNVNQADIFILIIGNRYGYVSDNGKSITNTEYLYAKEKGIPIYIFIFKSLITILPIWKANPTADFSNTVDNIKVFDFVEHLRHSDKNWCFEFEKAQEIVFILKIQLTHLFKKALDIRQKFNVSQQPDYWKDLSAKAINIALNKDEMFEPLFFLQVMKDELMKHEQLKLDLQYHILLKGNKGIKEPLELLSWIQDELQTLLNFIASGMNLMGKAYPFYYGEPGIFSDLKGLYYVSSSMARLFKEMILWSIDIMSTPVIEDFESIRDTFAKLILMSAQRIWEFPDNAINEISNAMELAKTGQKAVAECSLVFEMEESDSKFLNLEMERLVRKYSK